MPPKLAVPLHTHTDPESFLVLAGSLGIWLDGIWHQLGTGENLRLPGDAPHALRTSVDAPDDVLVMTCGCLLRFFSEAGRVVIGGAPPAFPTLPETGRVIGAAQRFGYRLAPPEEHARITGGTSRQRAEVLAGRASGGVEVLANIAGILKLKSKTVGSAAFPMSGRW